jgi:hypothetical protein
MPMTIKATFQRFSMQTAYAENVNAAMRGAWVERPSSVHGLHYTQAQEARRVEGPSAIIQP